MITFMSCTVEQQACPLFIVLCDTITETHYIMQWRCMHKTAGFYIVILIKSISAICWRLFAAFYKRSHFVVHL
jgi:hypothetical protein